eukprot:2175927-Pleurochrysis_carterae.AAC.1
MITYPVLFAQGLRCALVLAGGGEQQRDRLALREGDVLLRRVCRRHGGCDSRPLPAGEKARSRNAWCFERVASAGLARSDFVCDKLWYGREVVARG